MKKLYFLYNIKEGTAVFGTPMSGLPTQEYDEENRMKVYINAYIQFKVIHDGIAITHYCFDSIDTYISFPDEVADKLVKGESHGEFFNCYGDKLIIIYSTPMRMPSLTLSIISGYQYTDQRKFRNNFSMIFHYAKYKKLIEILKKSA